MVVRRNDDGKWTASLTPGAWFAVAPIAASIVGGWYVLRADMEQQRQLLERIEQRQIQLAERVSRIEGQIHE